MTVDDKKTDLEQGRREKYLRRIVIGCSVGIFVSFFWQVLFLPNSFAFRDASYFYFPLFEYIQGEWEAGRIPLWNPYENSGTPLMAHATASVFYPGKLLFFLPIPYSWAYKFYILGHIALAGAATYRLARHWGMGIAASGLAAMSYAFCGNVLFQCYNIVFLCGAAWLPVAFLVGEKMLTQRSIHSAVGLGTVIALMTLAGDPQMGYQAGMLIALYALFIHRESKQEQSSVCSGQNFNSQPKDNSSIENSHSRHGRFRLLCLAAGTSFLFSAIQVLPTYELSQRSIRAHSSLPKNLYDVPVYFLRDYQPVKRTDTGKPPHWYDALLGDLPPRIRNQRDVYRFSVAPWRLVEFIWPYFSGQLLPQNRRWIEVLGNEPAVWVPTFYMGLLPVLLALSGLQLRKGDVRFRLDHLGDFAQSFRIVWRVWIGMDYSFDL